MGDDEIISLVAPRAERKPKANTSAFTGTSRFSTAA
jgi:hypothetical protein